VNTPGAAWQQSQLTTTSCMPTQHPDPFVTHAVSSLGTCRERTCEDSSLFDNKAGGGKCRWSLMAQHMLMNFAAYPPGRRQMWSQKRKSASPAASVPAEDCTRGTLLADCACVEVSCGAKLHNSCRLEMRLQAAALPKLPLVALCADNSLCLSESQSWCGVQTTASFIQKR
jgi:hypothetical protein